MKNIVLLCGTLGLQLRGGTYFADADSRDVAERRHFGFPGVLHRAFSLVFDENRPRKHKRILWLRGDNPRHCGPRPRPPRAALFSTNPLSSFVPSRTRGDFSRGVNAHVRGSMGTTSSAPARDSRGDLRQRAAQQAWQPRYAVHPAYANAPQPFQGQQNYAAPRYYGQVRARAPAVSKKNPPFALASRHAERVTPRRSATLAALDVRAAAPNAAREGRKNDSAETSKVARAAG